MAPDDDDDDGEPMVFHLPPGEVSSAVRREPPAKPRDRIGISVASSVPWTDEQREAIRLCKFPEPGLVVGIAGSGKSELIHHIGAVLREEYGLRVSIVALTGRAASNLCCGAMTLDSWAGWGTGDESVDVLARRLELSSSNDAWPGWRWKHTDVLLIDELYMAGKQKFRLLDELPRRLRNTPTQAFGGLRVYGFGDCRQLEAIDKASAGDDDLMIYLPEFLSAFKHVIYLTRGMRQTQSAAFELCMRAREGWTHFTEADLNYFRSKVIPPSRFDQMCTGWLRTNPSVILPVYLNGRRSPVDQWNTKRLASLAGPLYTSALVVRVCCHTAAGVSSEPFGTYRPPTNPNGEPTFHRVYDESYVEKWLTLLNDELRHLPVTSILSFKLGSQVVLRKNLDTKNDLTNNTPGKIVRVDTLPSPIPSTTSSSSVPLSHASSIVWIRIAHRRLEQGIEWCRRSLPYLTQPVHYLPSATILGLIVDYCCSLIPIMPVTWKFPLNRAERSKPPGEWTRWMEMDQWPLALAEGMTVTSTQGLSLPKLYLNCSKASMFANGMAYVALSRLTDDPNSTAADPFPNLYLQDFDPNAFQSNRFTKEYEIAIQDQSKRHLAARAAYCRESSVRSTSTTTTSSIYPHPHAVSSVHGQPIKTSSSTITDDQRRRIQLNREQALERRHSQQQSRQPTTHRQPHAASSTPSSASMTMVAPTVTEEQRRRIQLNREQALERLRTQHHPPIAGMSLSSSTTMITDPPMTSHPRNPPTAIYPTTISARISAPPTFRSLPTLQFASTSTLSSSSSSSATIVHPPSASTVESNVNLPSIDCDSIPPLEADDGSFTVSPECPFARRKRQRLEQEAADTASSTTAAASKCVNSTAVDQHPLASSSSSSSASLFDDPPPPPSRFASLFATSSSNRTIPQSLPRPPKQTVQGISFRRPPPTSTTPLAPASASSSSHASLFQCINEFRYHC